MSLHDIPAATISTAQSMERSLAALGDSQLMEDFRALNNAKVDAEENLAEANRKLESLRWTIDQLQQLIADDTFKNNSIIMIADDLSLNGYERINKIRALFKDER